MDIEQAIEEFGAAMLATARRWSATDHDAEDAFQHAVERALHNRPVGTPGELRAWLRATVRNEALAIVRRRRRTAPGGCPDALAGAPLPTAQAPPEIDVQTERLDRLRRGSQALRQLKPQEIRALQLQAEGHSYAEIAAITGWSATKVNRCLTEGRRAFERALEGIEAGAECARLSPALAAAARGRPTDELDAIRGHLTTCLACRARLRRLRAAA